MNRPLALVGFAVAIACHRGTRPGPTPPRSPTPRRAAASSAEITVLSTMLADRGIGEWGFAALVDVDGQRILFDTGQHRDTVIRNAKSLGIDLGRVTDVVLSHHHDDHVGGLLALRNHAMAREPNAMSRIHVAAGIFAPRRLGEPDREVNDMLAIRPAFEATGGTFVVHSAPTMIAPGVWVTGPVRRVHAERNWSGRRRIRTDGGWAQDTIPESQSLVIVTARGLVVLSGCGHAGIVNTVEYARAAIHNAPVLAVVGGFHLLDADDAQLAWTADHLRSAGVANVYGGHCTGLEPVYRFRQLLGLDRKTAAVAAVGGRYSAQTGIHAGALAD